MNLINITSDSGDSDALFKDPEFPVLPAGKHTFVVANKLAVIDSSTGTSDLIKAEFRCQDEDANKGMGVFHNFVFIKDPQTDGQKKSREINQAEYAQFVVSCGVATEAQVKAGENFDLDDFETKVFEAVSVVKLENTQEIGEDGKPKKAQKASIKKFLFEPASE